MSSQNETDNINPADYSTLSNFLRGYLHQDAVVVHGSAAQAARTFRNDVDEREAAIVHAELERLLEDTRTVSDSEVARILEQLGSAWRFRSREELEQIRDALK